MIKRVLMIFCTGIALAGCTGVSTSTLFEQTVDSLRNEGRPAPSNSVSSRSLFGSGKTAGFSGAQVEGSNSFVSSTAPMINEGKTRSGENGYTLTASTVDEKTEDGLRASPLDAVSANY